MRSYKKSGKLCTLLQFFPTFSDLRPIYPQKKGIQPNALYYINITPLNSTAKVDV